MRPKHLVAALAGTATLSVAAIVAVIDYIGSQVAPSRGGTTVGADGPVAGAGLPFVLIAGGYFLVRRYRDRTKVE